jgi:hypothetical protein
VSGGFYLMHRGWLDHPVLGGKREPFCRRAAWAWLIEQASFVPTRVNVSGQVVELQRGQLCHSLRYMAKAWGWDDAKVRRFLAAVEDASMIRRVTDAGQTVITICNYDRYQAASSVGDAPSDAAATQQRRGTDAKKKEGNQGKEDGGGGDARAPEAAAADDDEARFIVDRFLSLREELWPQDGRLPAPTHTLLSQARGYLDASAPVELVHEVVDRVMRQSRNRADGPPTNLHFCRRSIESAASAHANASATVMEPDHHGTHASTRLTRHSAHASFVAAGAEVADRYRRKDGGG